jgi:hypothetical protein
MQGRETMLNDKDIQRGYPEDKEQTALFQLVIIIAFILLVIFRLIDFFSNSGP